MQTSTSAQFSKYKLSTYHVYAAVLKTGKKDMDKQSLVGITAQVASYSFSDATQRHTEAHKEH